MAKFIEKETNAISFFNRKKVLPVKELTRLLDCSIPTVRRRLKQWGTYTSYNLNGRYYTLSTIPTFDENGLWQYKNILFSKHGNLKRLVIHLIQHSHAGLTARETEKIVQVSMCSYMPCFRDLTELIREKVAGCFVYFSSDKQIRHMQKKRRLEKLEHTRLTKLPADTETIVVLVERIKCPHLSIEQLSAKLNKRGHSFPVESIACLFEHHGILKKTEPTQP